LPQPEAIGALPIRREASGCRHSASSSHVRLRMQSRAFLCDSMYARTPAARTKERARGYRITLCLRRPANPAFQNKMAVWDCRAITTAPCAKALEDRSPYNHPRSGHLLNPRPPRPGPGSTHQQPPRSSGIGLGGAGAASRGELGGGVNGTVASVFPKPAAAVIILSAKRTPFHNDATFREIRAMRLLTTIYQKNFGCRPQYIALVLLFAYHMHMGVSLCAVVMKGG